jgi:hypothetical protein
VVDHATSPKGWNLQDLSVRRQLAHTLLGHGTRKRELTDHGRQTKLERERRRNPMKKMILAALTGVLFLLPSLGFAKSPFTRTETWQAKRAIAEQLNQKGKLSGKLAYSSRGVKLTQVKQIVPAGFGASRYDTRFAAVPKMKLGGCYGTCELDRPVVLKPMIKAYKVKISGLLR